MKATVGRSQLGVLAVVTAVIVAACALVLVNSTQASAQTTTQPLIEYKFDEGFGNTATNTGSLGTDANENIAGDAIYSTDTPTGTSTGSSLDFGGGRVMVRPVCDSSESEQCSPRHGQDQVTVEAWVKPDAFDGQRVIYDDYGNPGVLMTVWDDQVQFAVSTTTNGPAQGSLGANLFAGHLEANKWQHIAGVYDGTGLRIYIDGQDTGEFVSTSGAIVSLPGSFAAIGNGNAEYLPFDGKVDDFRVFGVGLQPDQLAGGHFAAASDTTKPTLAFPSDITKVTADSNGTQVNYVATATDDVDGNVPVECSPASGTTFPLGTTSVNCSATDQAGNQATGSFNVNVLYDFGNGSGGGFAEPVTDSALNQVKAGSGVPVKFGLGGDLGLDIFAAGYPSSRKISCDTQAVIDPIEQTVAVSSSGLKYDATTAQYIYSWKTEKAWANTCRQLVIKLKDGSEHPVNFKFK